MLLFLYGTLLDPAVLARQSGERGLARRLRPARLDGYARVPLRGTPYPTLVRRPGAETPGAVLRAGPDARRRLAAYEGPQYRLAPVRVETPRGPVRARAWAAARWRAAGDRGEVQHGHRRSGSGGMLEAPAATLSPAAGFRRAWCAAGHIARNQTR